MEYLQRITILERDKLKMVSDVKIDKGEASSSMTKLIEVEGKAKHDVKMVTRCYHKMTTFHREANANYLAGLNESRAVIIMAHPEIDFSFIASMMKTQPDPTF